MLKRSFKRLYWRISDVCELTGLDQQTLRGWEQDFKQLRPRRDSSGVRVYRERELRLVILLNELIAEDKQEIAEVRRFLNDNKKDLNDLLDAIDLEAITEQTDERLAPTSTVETESVEEEKHVAESEPTVESIEEPEEPPTDEVPPEESPVEEPSTKEITEEETVVEEPPAEEPVAEEPERAGEVEVTEEPEPESETDDEAEPATEAESVQTVDAVEKADEEDETPRAERLPTDIPSEPIDTSVVESADETELVEAEEVSAVEPVPEPEPVEAEQTPPAEEPIDEEPPVVIPPEPVETAPAEGAVETADAAIEEEPVAAPEPEVAPEEPAVLEAAPILNTRFALRFVDIADEVTSEQPEPEATQPIPDTDLPLEPTDVRFALAVVRRDLTEEPVVVPAVIAEEIVPEAITPLANLDAEEPVDVAGAFVAHRREAEPVEPEPPPFQPLPGIDAEEPIGVHEPELREEPTPTAETAAPAMLDALVADEPINVVAAVTAHEPPPVDTEPVAQPLPEPTYEPLAALDATEPVDLPTAPAAIERPVEAPGLLAAIDVEEPIDVHAAMPGLPSPVSHEMPVEVPPEPSYEPIPSLNVDEPVDVLAALIVTPTPAAIEQEVATEEVVDAAADERFALSFVTPVVVDDEPIPETMSVFEPLVEVVTEEPTTVRDALAAPPPTPDDEPETVVTPSYEPLPALDAAEPVDLPRLTRVSVPEVAPLPLDAIDADEPVDVLAVLSAPTPHVAVVAPDIDVDEALDIETDTRFALGYIIPVTPEPEPVAPHPSYAPLDAVGTDEPTGVLSALATTPAAEPAPTKPEPIEKDEAPIAPLDARFALAYVVLGPAPDPEPEAAFEPLETVAVEEPVDLLEAEVAAEVGPIEELPEVAVNERFALAYVTPAPSEAEPESTPERTYETLPDTPTDEPITVLTALAAPPPAIPDVDLSEEPFVDEEPPDVEVDERFSLAYVSAASHLESEQEPEPEPAYERLREVVTDEPVGVLGAIAAPPPTPLVKPVSNRLPDWAADELRNLRADFVAMLDFLETESDSEKPVPEDSPSEESIDPENSGSGDGITAADAQPDGISAPESSESTDVETDADDDQTPETV